MCFFENKFDPYGRARANPFKKKNIKPLNDVLPYTFNYL